VTSASGQKIPSVSEEDVERMKLQTRQQAQERFKKIKVDKEKSEVKQEEPKVASPAQPPPPAEPVKPKPTTRYVSHVVKRGKPPVASKDIVLGSQANSDTYHWIKSIGLNPVLTGPQSQNSHGTLASLRSYLAGFQNSKALCANDAVYFLDSPSYKTANVTFVHKPRIVRIPPHHENSELSNNIDLAPGVCTIECLNECPNIQENIAILARLVTGTVEF